ncbi:MAG TPA: cache domain-containing protein, partial [Geothrix sp.]|nr:cache domain-containing protein [Geothrix sp.]
MTDLSRSSRLTPSTFIKAMGALLVLVNLMALTAAVWLLTMSRRHFVERAESTTQNLAEFLEDNVADTTQRIDAALQAAQDEVRHDPAHRRLGTLVQTQVRRVQLLASLQVADARGKIVHAAPAGPRKDVGDQPFFLKLQAATGDELVFSPPVRDASGAWVIVLARRLVRGDGRFAGVVFAQLPTEQLARTMSRLDVGRHGSVSLRGADLSLLARYPDFEGQQRMTGETRIQGTYLQAIQSGSTTYQFTERSVLDGTRRTYTMRRTDDPRFFLLVGLAESEYLRTWRHQVAFAVAAVLGLAALTLALGGQARASWIRQVADQERLTAQEARYRLLAENATDVIWSMDPDGRLTYVSPSILRQRGWTPEEFMALAPENRALSRKGSEIFRERMDKARQLPPGSQPF